MLLTLLFTEFSLTISLIHHVSTETHQETNNHCIYYSQDCDSNFGTQMHSTRQDENALAVIPYNKDSLLPHQQTDRKFTFAGHKIHVKQKWQAMGVAAVVWDAAVVLCEYLEQNPDIVKDKSVLELGAGTGLAGMVASLLGGDVTVTERQEAVENLRHIVKQNIPADRKISTAVLDWTQNLSDFKRHYDVVIGADIIYIEDTFFHLKRTLLHLCSEKTTLLLSCKIRYDRDKKFLTILKENFDIEEVFHDYSRDIFIYLGKLKFR